MRKYHISEEDLREIGELVFDNGEAYLKSSKKKIHELDLDVYQFINLECQRVRIRHSVAKVFQKFGIELEDKLAKEVWKAFEDNDPRKTYEFKKKNKIKLENEKR